MKQSPLTIITGGIGSGKSVVSRILLAMGYPVYDCDSRAKAIMDADADLRLRIGAEVCPKALLPDGTLHRPTLAAAVFGDAALLKKLNSLVHGAVRQDLSEWIEKQCCEGHPRVFAETAIPSAPFVAMAGDVWNVEAPEELRIQRVMKRNGLSADEVRQRIRSQRPFSGPAHGIDNSGVTAVLPQILKLL